MVAFRDCREAMPEIEDGYNALLGDTPAEVAALVAEAMRNRELRRRIGRGGVETLRLVYSPEIVTRELITRMRASLDAMNVENRLIAPSSKKFFPRKLFDVE